MKDWKDLTISDDYMFKLIMSRKRICKQMLERILRIEIKDIHYLETEKSIAAHYHSKGIRLDVLLFLSVRSIRLMPVDTSIRSRIYALRIMGFDCVTVHEKYF